MICFLDWMTIPYPNRIAFVQGDSLHCDFDWISVSMPLKAMSSLVQRIVGRVVSVYWVTMNVSLFSSICSYPYFEGDL